MNTQTQAPQAAESLEALCQQARVLATALPGALTRLTVMAGPNRVEVEWLATATVPAAGNGAAGTGAEGNGTAATAAEITATAENAIVAPLVGTFYRAGEPDAPPFVAEGDIVEVGQQIAIVEAMKIMNSVEADRAGRVAKVLAKDGDMVEFEQPLMIIEPADAGS